MESYARFYIRILKICMLFFIVDNVKGDSVRYIVMGDWGGLPDFPYRTPVESAVAREMGKIASKLDVQFILALGDNFYFDGVKDVDDPRFKETFEDIFTAPSLQVPWWFIAGNHDHNGNVSAQIEYSHRVKRWNYPYYYYPVNVPVPGGGQIDILMLDTVLLCGNSDADKLGLQPSGPLSNVKADKQWTWLEKQLQASTATYLIVTGHYPVFSVAEHGPTECLVKQLMPMLHKYGATAYFNGHDHNIQHLEYTYQNHTVQYFVSGAANFVEPSRKHENDVPPNSLKYFWGDIFSLGSFAYVETTPQNMTFKFLEANGKELYSKVMLPRKQKS